MDFPRTATYTRPRGDEPNREIFTKEEMIYDMVYGSQEINNIPASYTLREDEAEDLGEMKRGVAALFESIRNHLEVMRNKPQE